MKWFLKMSLVEGYKSETELWGNFGHAPCVQLGFGWRWNADLFTGAIKQLKVWGYVLYLNAD